jgi:hypothetical protein
MSLIQHVSCIEGVDRETCGEVTVRRVLSYDAFPRFNEDDLQPSIAAYKVPLIKRIGVTCPQSPSFDYLCLPCSSSGSGNHLGMLACLGHCFWVRCA